METFGVRLAKSTFLYWILFAIFSIYFFTKFDIQKFKNTEGSLLSRVIDSAKFKNLRLGIDLQGGTRLVLKIDEQKVIKGKLADTGRSLEKILKQEQIITLNKSIEKNVLILEFEMDAEASQAYNVAKKDFKNYDVVQEDKTIKLTLSSSEKANIVDAAAEKASTVLKNRLDGMAVRGLTISRHGNAKLVVQLPGVDDLADIKDAISRAAKLEFKLVYDSASNENKLIDKYDGVLPPDKTIVSEEDGSAFLVSEFADVSGSRIINARASLDQLNRPAVTFFLDSEGGRDFREVTRENIGKRLAIIMDGKVIQAPQISTEIGKEKSGMITGIKDQKEATRMSQLLKSGSMDASLVIEQESTVGASLGGDSISRGLIACLVALLALFIFSIMYYKLAGLLAAFALVYNILVLLVMMAFLKATLTLSGIFGIVLTVGMAIDASILIYERIREELKSDSISFKEAVETGFSDAMEVILDSNITTFLAGAVLFWYGGPTVKGFAVSLMIGIISTVITGVYFLKSTFDFCIKVLGWKKISI